MRDGLTSSTDEDLKMKQAYPTIIAALPMKSEVMMPKYDLHNIKFI